MLDFLGVTENWSAIENIPWTQRWTFSDESTLEPVSLDGVTFTGRVHLEGRPEPVELDIQKSAAVEEANVLIVSCIGLPEGRHAYEIYSVSESGNQNRLISGSIGVIKSIDKLVNELKTYASRTLSIRLPGHVTRQIRLEWLSCTLAAASAQQAWEYYEQVKQKAEGMEETARKAEEAVEKLSGLDEKLDTLDQAVQDARDAAAEAEQWATDASRKGDPGLTSYIGPNGNWWTGEGEQAVDSGIRAVPIDGEDGKDGQDGEDGKSPVIRYFEGTVAGISYSGNYWYVWGLDPDTGEHAYIFTGILAEGKNGTPGRDGLDADAITRLYLDSADDLPRPGNHGTVCYIPVLDPETHQPTGQYTVYCWLRQPDGTADWLPVNQDLHDYSRYALTDMTNLSAGADDYETQYPDNYLPRLSYLKRALAAAIQNTITQIARAATTQLLGMIKLGTATVQDPAHAGMLGINQDGNAMTPEAKANSHGTVRLGTSVKQDAAASAVVGVNEAGQLLVPEGKINSYGTSKYRNNKNVVNGALVDTNANGALIVPLAGYRSYGTVCFGTQYDITINNAPHVLTLPKCNGEATYNKYAGNMVNAICINLAQQGCLKYNGSGPNGPNTGNSLYLSHDSSLTISGGSLGVVRYQDIVFHDSYASTDKGGSVKIGSNLEISQEGVLTVSIGTMDSELPVSGQTVKQYIGSLGHVTASELEAKNYVTRPQHNADLAARVECAGGIKKLAYMSEDEYGKLAVKDASTLYLLY